MTELHLAPHSRRDRNVCEVWQAGDLIALIYPSEDGVRIVSKYLSEPDLGSYLKLDPRFPMALDIKIRKEKP